MVICGLTHFWDARAILRMYARVLDEPGFMAPMQKPYVGPMRDGFTGLS